MRMSQLFSQTLREAPSEAEVVSHRLLLRAGFIRQLAAEFALHAICTSLFK
jgi:prolyl-tRNA synthetase